MLGKVFLLGRFYICFDLYTRVGMYVYVLSKRNVISLQQILVD